MRRGQQVSVDGFVDAVLLHRPADPVLSLRGEMRACCPSGRHGRGVDLSPHGRLTMFYMAVGSVYRLSLLLGVFTAHALVCFLLSISLDAWDCLTRARSARSVVDGWRESHAAFSVLAYGALGLAAVAGVMFIVLNQAVERCAHSGTGLFANLPPARDLSQVGWAFVVAWLLPCSP